MYTQIFLVTSVRGMVLPPQIFANASLSFFGAKMPFPAFFMANAFFLPAAFIAFFASVIQLNVGEVLVYPEGGSTKPPPGEGLNRPATVTMFQCWPPAGVNIQDPRAEERYRRKIQSMTERKSARFLDYDCSTGIWRFEVDHF